MLRSGLKLLRNTDGAVAPTIALSLVGLIAAGGIAFDYSRLASLDTELQDAADQAALAAATQLDRQPNATARAIAATQSLVTNQTRFANDGVGITVETGQSGTDASGNAIVRVRFYSNKTDAEADTNSFLSTATGADASAKFVKVQVTARKANYALTPIARVFTSGVIGGEATAGLGSAICKVPPLMMCNPQENVDPANPLAFNVGTYKGVGVRLVQGGGNGSGAWVPGNFGYLESSLGSGANALAYSLGANSPPGDCLAGDGVTTKPGANTSATDAINTRFDIYESSPCTLSTCSPSNNVRKDVVRPNNGSTNFGFKTGNDPWDLPSVEYLPSGTGAYASPYPTSMGMPRDTCHSVSAAGTCAPVVSGNGSRIGNGTWDRDLYFFVNHKSEYPGTTPPSAPDGTWKTIPSLKAYAEGIGYTTTGSNPTIGNITRYDVYKWEIQANSLAAHLDHQVTPPGKGKAPVDYNNYATPQATAGLPASTNQPDRRLISMAVINCAQQDLHGQGTNVVVAKWVELFLVEPSLDRTRTSKGDIYIEVVRETDAGGSAPTNAQVVKRDVPYLVR
jgi:Flp pilus assembly protein TadG